MKKPRNLITFSLVLCSPLSKKQKTNCSYFVKISFCSSPEQIFHNTSKDVLVAQMEFAHASGTNVWDTCLFYRLIFYCFLPTVFLYFYFTYCIIIVVKFCFLFTLYFDNQKGQSCVEFFKDIMTRKRMKYVIWWEKTKWPKFTPTNTYERVGGYSLTIIAANHRSQRRHWLVPVGYHSNLLSCRSHNRLRR